MDSTPSNVYITPKTYIEIYEQDNLDSIKEWPQIVTIFFSSHLFEMMASKSSNRKPVELAISLGTPVRKLISCSINQKRIWMLLLDLGAPLLGFFIEIFFELGIKKLLLCTTAGGTNRLLVGGEIFILRNAYSQNGLTNLYYKDRVCFSSTFDFSGLDMNIWKKFSIKEFDALSTDGFFRESYSLIETFRKKGVHVVEMEAATAFAIAEYRNLEVGVIGYVADLLIEKTWQCLAKEESTRIAKERMCELVKELISKSL
ncbi:MAG: nucleoside phosphorylase [Deltaproteobacteria bacterium]|nr:nucleoside phosphorylase [Deltaproteobacteria bacterium]